MRKMRLWRRQHRRHKREEERKKREADRKHRVKKMRVKADNRLKKIEKKGIEVHKPYEEPEWRKNLDEQRKKSKPADTRDG